MAIKRVWIEEGCISCGMSEMNCPEVFKSTMNKTHQLLSKVLITHSTKQLLKKPLKVAP